MVTIHMLMQYTRSFTMQYHRDLQRKITQQQIGSQVRECSTTARSDVWYLVHGHTHRWKQVDLTQTISDTFLSISVNGKQYASSGADYCYGINVNASDEEKQAALVFVKWMTEKSGYAYNEDSLALVPGSESKISFDGVDFFADEPALEGEEDYLNQLNSESELNVSNGGNDKIQAIIEHAANGDMSFDDIMAEWNQKWSDAQESLGIEVTEK